MVCLFLCLNKGDLFLRWERLQPIVGWSGSEETSSRTQGQEGRLGRQGEHGKAVDGSISLLMAPLPPRDRKQGHQRRVKRGEKVSEA